MYFSVAGWLLVWAGTLDLWVGAACDWNEIHREMKCDLRWVVIIPDSCLTARVKFVEFESVSHQIVQFYIKRPIKYGIITGNYNSKHDKIPPPTPHNKGGTLIFLWFNRKSCLSSNDSAAEARLCNVGWTKGAPSDNDPNFNDCFQ